MRSVTKAGLTAGLATLCAANEGGAFELALQTTPCGSRAALVQKVQARLTQPHPEAWHFTVRIDQSEGRYVATVDMLDPSGLQSRRVVAGNQCYSVFDAAALVTALTLESGFSAMTVAADLETPARLERSEAKGAWRAALGLTGNGGVQSSLGDPVGWFASAGLAFWLAGTTRSMVSLEYRRAQGTVRDDDHRAKLFLDAAELRVAPEVLGLGAGLGLVPALGLELGRLRGDGRFEGGRESQGFWGAALAELGLDYRYRYLQVGVAPILGVAFKRHEFEAGGAPLYQSPRANLGGRLRVTVWAN